MTQNKNESVVVVQEIQALNKWETAQYNLQKVISAGTNGNIFQQFLFGNKILLVVYGSVTAGFDLTGVTSKDVHISGSNIALSLPAPTILQTTIDNSKTQVYDRQQGLLVSPTNNLQSQALVTAQNEMQAAACSDGILTQASSNAKKQLGSLLTPFGFTHVVITIPDGHC